MNHMVPTSKMALPSLMAQYIAQHGGGDDEFSAGVSGGYAVVGYRGKVWRIKHRGEETTLMRPDGDGPRASIEVVLVRANATFSKVWYENGYTDGSNAPPDCFSGNSVKADPSSPKLQNNGVCGTCPRNQWGSKASPDGKGNGKACADSRRVAVVPLEDLDNEEHGGPMLLRIPAASLQELATYSKKLGTLGARSFAVATRVSFDTNEAYPKMLFTPVRGLTEEEAAKVLELREDARTLHLLQEKVELDAAPADEGAQETPPVPGEPVDPLAAAFAKLETAPAAPQAAPQAAAKPAPAPVTQKVAQPAPAPAVPAHDPVTGEIVQDAEVVEPIVTSETKLAAAAKPAPKAAAAKPAPAPAANGAAPQDFDALLDSLL